MKRFLSTVLISAFALALVPGMTLVASATTCPTGQTYVKAYTKADGTKVSGYCKSSGKAMASPAAMASKAPSAMKSMAPAAMASSKPASMKGADAMKPAAGTCPPGKTYVNGYTKSNGTKVAGYCRSKPSK